MKTSLKSILKITSIPVVVTSLCCLTPIVLVFFGLGSVSIAASLADTLYGTYKWAFRIAGLVLLGLSLVWYLRREKGICTLDEAKMRRNEIFNLESSGTSYGYMSWWNTRARTRSDYTDDHTASAFILYSRII